MELRFESGKPIFLQLEEIIRNDIVAGRYKPDEKIPGVRELAMCANVNPNTMQRALSNLETEGLLVTRGTSGRFVCKDPEKIEAAKVKMIERLADEFIDRCNMAGIDPVEVAEIIRLKENEERMNENE